MPQAALYAAQTVAIGLGWGAAGAFWGTMSAAVADARIVGLDDAAPPDGGPRPSDADYRDALAQGEFRVEKYPGLSTRARLVGPGLIVGRCLEAAGLEPGCLAFADPELQAHAGDIVMVRNGAPPSGFPGYSLKRLEFAAGRWWLCSTDGMPPIELTRSVMILGVLVASLHLPPHYGVVRWAEQETQRLEGLVPADFREKSARIAADAIAELEMRTATKRIPYPWRVMVGDLFWRTLGAPSISSFDEAMRSVCSLGEVI